MEEETLYSQLNDVFRDIFMKSDFMVSPTMTAKDVDGWDSFKQIEILIAVEERFSIKFTSKDLDALNNVGDLVSAISSKIKS